MATERLIWTGTAPVSELPYTGRQRSWPPQQANDVDTAYTAALLAVAGFRYADGVTLTAAQVASPPAGVVANLTATYQLNAAPYTRYQSNGTTLVSLGSGGAGVTDGDKGDVIVSATGTVWTLDPAVFVDDLGTILNQANATATEVSAGSIIAPAGSMAAGRTIVIDGRITASGATAKTLRARVTNLAGTVVASLAYTTAGGLFSLQICRTAGVDASATLQGAAGISGTPTNGTATPVDITAGLTIVVSLQGAAAESIALDWAKARIL